MRATMQRIKHRAAEQRGATLVEYALLLSLIALVAFTALTYFGKSNGGSLNHSRDCIQAAQDGLPPPAGC